MNTQKLFEAKHSSLVLIILSYALATGLYGQEKLEYLDLKEADIVVGTPAYAAMGSMLGAAAGSGIGIIGGPLGVILGAKIGAAAGAALGGLGAQIK